MTLTMYERIGHEGRRPSPFSWRIRYAFAHKGIEPEFRHVRFADVETIRRLSGQHFTPIMTHGDRVIHDSWNIACYLEDEFPDRPPLFAGPGGRGLARYVNHWSDHARRRDPPPDRRRFHPLSRSWRPRLLPQLTRSRVRLHAGGALRRPSALARRVRGCGRAARTHPRGTAAPGYADYVLFSVFQYARLGCPDEFLDEGSALRRWRDGLVRAFDGLGDRYPEYPARG